MRIAFYAPRASFLQPDLSMGGDPIFLDNLFTTLRERGHEVRIVSRVNVRDFWRGRLPAWRFVTEAIAIRRQIKQFSPDAWLVYGTSVTYPDLFGWWQQPKRYVLFKVDPWTSKRMPRRWGWLFALAFRRSLARADKVGAHRPKCADRLRSLGVAADRLCVLHVGAKVWKQMPSREEARRRLGLPQEAPVIMSVSRFTGPNERKERKTEMVLDLLAALAPLPSNVILVVVGDGPSRQRVEEEVARLKLDGRVRLIGAVPPDEIRWFYAACDFHVYPHLLDRPWLSVLEAQGCGRPVVTMHTRSAEVTVDAGRTGLLAKDLDQFQAHIATLASDRARCESMGQAAHKYIAKFHSIEARVQQIENLLLGHA